MLAGLPSHSLARSISPTVVNSVAHGHDCLNCLGVTGTTSFSIPVACGSSLRQIRNELCAYDNPLTVIMIEKDLFSLSWLGLDFHCVLNLKGLNPNNTFYNYKTIIKIILKSPSHKIYKTLALCEPVQLSALLLRLPSFP